MRLRRAEAERILGHKIVTVWEKSDLSYLELNYGRTPAKEIAIHLNRSVSGVRYMAKELGLQAKPRWTKEQERFLLEHDSWPRAEIAQAVGKTPTAVNQKLKRLRAACIS